MGRVRDIVFRSPVLRVPYTKFIGFSICINGSGSGYTADLMYKIEYSLRDDQR